MDDEKDFLDNVTEESTAANPNFPGMLEAAGRARRLLEVLARAREEAGLTLAEVAGRTGISEDELDSLEAGEEDPYLSTVMAYAMAIGVSLEVWRR